MQNLQDRIDVVLIGRKLPDNENLGLGYLAAALEQAGFRAEMHALNTWPDMEKICGRVVETDPVLVGLALPDGGSSFLPLGMGEYLRRRGYRGHITAGGGFATLARAWLLGRYGWLDSVVRFAGEVPITLLTQKLKACPADIDDVPGLTTRQGDGKPAPVMDRTQLEIFPVHEEFPEILGHPMTHIAGTRGCPGRCLYCGPAALQNLEREEGAIGGHGRDELIRCGIGGIRTRGIDSVCDEMARLYHRKDVRYFYFVDEHLLPRREADALKYLREWKEGLMRRGVKDFGIGNMLRADFITPAVAEAFVDLGLVRCFIGVELASDGELKKFSRGGNAGRNLEIMALLERLGVASVCNVMLVHPYSTVETIRGGIDFLGKIDHGTFEATQMQVYHGTRLHERMRLEGRLTGNPLRYSYSYLDETVARFAQIFSRLRGEAFRDYSLSYHVHDLWLAIALAARIHPDISMDSVLGKARDVTQDLNRLRVEAYGRAIELAVRGKGFHECGGLIRETKNAAIEIQGRADAIGRSILLKISRPAKIYSPMKTAAAYVLNFCLAGASLSGCYASSPHGPGDASEEEDRDMALDPPSDAGEEPRVCSYAEVEAVKEEVGQRASSVDPCLSMSISYPEGNTSPRVFIDGMNYGGTEMVYCRNMIDRLEETRNEIIASLEDLDLTCFRDQYVVVEGGDERDMELMQTTVREACTDVDFDYDWHKVTIYVDAEGNVLDVLARFPDDPPRPESIECIKSALAGLVFPCLANYQVCPEYLVGE